MATKNEGSPRGLSEQERKRISALIESHRSARWALIPLLQAIQEEIGYIPPASVREIADRLRLFPAQVQGVISFYAQFYTEPKGKYLVRVCRGTSCHVRGGREILTAVKESLGIDEGETTADMLFSLESVACLGTCFLSPAIMVGKDYYGLLVPRKIPSILENYRKGKKI
jgi:NADH:ubiquinone oxidoreductase subunit E